MKYFDLKLYRKFFVLAILLGGLAMAFSGNQAKASGDFCCSVCDEPWMQCIAECDYMFPDSPVKRQACIQQYCWPSYYWCMQQGACDPGC
jgi:hypothetical protein